jgi:hypothetical protein
VQLVADCCGFWAWQRGGKSAFLLELICGWAFPLHFHGLLEANASNVEEKLEGGGGVGFERRSCGGDTLDVPCSPSIGTEPEFV